MVRTCSKCGQTGHDRRTCEQHATHDATIDSSADLRGSGLDLNSAFGAKDSDNAIYDDIAAFIVPDHTSEPASEPASEPIVEDTHPVEQREPVVVPEPIENPPVVDAPTSPFTDPNKPYRELSWTVGKQKQQDVTVAWVTQTKAWMLIHALKCVMNNERGDVANNLHMQCVSAHNMLDTDLPILIDNYKRFLPAGRCATMFQA